MSRAWGRGSTRAQRRVRERILIRDGRRCKIALEGTWVTRRGEVQQCAGVADCVHHTHGRAATGDDPRFMVAACTPCNLKVGDPSKAVAYDPPGRGHTTW